MMKLHLQKTMISRQVFPLILLISTLLTPSYVKAENIKLNNTHKSVNPVSVVKTWTGGTGNWNVASKWSPVGIPSPTDIVQINGGTSIVTIPKGYWARATQLILDGSTLNINGTGRLSISGSLDDGLLMNQGTIFRNKGILEIDNVMKNGISTVGQNSTSTFTNEGVVRIGGKTAIGGKGIYLTKTLFDNTLAGRLFIDRTDNDFAMILTVSSTFRNEGEITLGGTSAVRHGIDSPDDFINNGILTFSAVGEDGITAQTKIVNIGSIDVAVSCNLNMMGTIDNRGFITIDGSVANNGSMTNSGFLTVFPEGELLQNGNFESNSFIRNFGLLSVYSGKTLKMLNTGVDPVTFYNEITGIFNVEGLVDISAGGVFISNGKTQGNFAIKQVSDFNNDAYSVIAPGIGVTRDVNTAMPEFVNDIATLTSNGNLDLMSSTLEIEANDATPSLYDVLSVIGSVTISPTSVLKVVHGGGYIPVTGDELTVIKSSTPVTGTFAAANLLIPSGWTVRYDYPATGDVTLTYVQLLPVELVSFKAINKGESNLLTWETASETTNKGFEVQRKNEQGEWIEMGFVKGNGGPSVYKFTDNDPLSISYYRLRQVDHDGKFEYSNVVSVTKERKLKVQVYPNPTYGKVTVQLANEAQADVSVYNLVGQTVMTNVVLSTMGELDLSGLARGTYIVEIKSEGVVARQKVVKQ
jgi:Secretion system C-terminal sorting domain